MTYPGKPHPFVRGVPPQVWYMCSECFKHEAHSVHHKGGTVMTYGLVAGVKVCDDCCTEYAGPAYYTFPSDECRTSDHDGAATPHLGCTGNLCPRCAGPDLEPDRAGDPRRPVRA